MDTSPTEPSPYDKRLDHIEARLDRGSQNMSEIRADVSGLRAELAGNTEVTNEVRELLEAGKNGLKVLGWIGVGAKWLGGIAAALTALWTLLYAITHNGQLPK